jgi:hypothetical protein
MAQKCFVTTSVPAKPPKSGKFETMRAAPDVGYYSTSATRIYDTYDSTGFGPYTQIDPENTFWKDKDDVNPGPMNRCAVWGNGNPKE